MQIVSHPKVTEIFNNYPPQVKLKMDALRALVLNTADNVEGLEKLEETLKWNEPSYVTKHGSTLRIDWKPKAPNQYAMYFQCTSQLVSTFKIIYKGVFKFEGNRAIIFNLNETIPVTELKHCITLALTYHKIKHLPLLGA
ncbi:hypothetical protein PK35_11765 [Tamlana nanhaiensis]|uniref:YdhG-like domain-containing protein n=1 Tax=Neotamlana nanhaiensis TaxID=1382798 RepID=A0A0D7W077_9FLAO|nr:DUF1801 domain-containing protein [Tamlana nanhaiensis]KJD32108.1 hypothetical protein PK35_10880 [Tamlana nanhaiensis]KJD32270.1 hypothetical protein PK35_11765 [Tamlana nanhaiensis]